MPTTHASPKGLDLARALFETCRSDLFSALPEEVTAVLAAGLVGEGSECFGFDDAVSRDHDWGPAFCLWLPEEDLGRHAATIERALEVLPLEFSGFPVRMAAAQRNERVGPLSIERFYARFLRVPHVPRTWQEWHAIPEHHYAVCTNGAVFLDQLATRGDRHPYAERPVTSLTTIRNSLLRYYPDDLRLKKIAARCALMAQSGQYNLLRSLKRDDPLTATLCAARFAEQACMLAHHLARRFTPFYKWVAPSAAHVSPLGEQIAQRLRTLLGTLPAFEQGTTDDAFGRMEALVEEICVACITELHAQDLSDATDGWLMEHASNVQSRIETPELARAPVFSG